MLPIDIPQPISDFLLMVNSNRDRITYRHFRPLVLRYSPYRPVAEERPAIST